jgi:excisionase family DNA binding protein
MHVYTFLYIYVNEHRGGSKRSNPLKVTNFASHSGGMMVENGLVPVINSEQISNTRTNFTESLWTVEETAMYLKLNAETIRAMARRGDLPAKKIGKVWRFDPAMIRNIQI